MTDADFRWSEENSQVYRELAKVAVPARALQMATLLTLIPFAANDPFRVVELASGEGFLAHAILQAFPRSTLLALDGEPTMRDAAAARLKPFDSRVSVAAFDMFKEDWYQSVQGADVVVSSLCVHHLTGAQKQRLFAAVASRLSDPGAFLIADLIQPQPAEARELFAATWDRAAHEQSIVETGTSRLYDYFATRQWNYFQYPDDFDKPSPLYSQLNWLSQAGFSVVDCFWMQAGHAIYGGYKAAENVRGSLKFDAAFEAAKGALQS